MKIGDLVKMEDDNVLGMIMELNADAEPSIGPCWHVFWFAYSRRLPAWEHELEIVSEGR